jgi:hypothetical protein
VATDETGSVSLDSRITAKVELWLAKEVAEVLLVVLILAALVGLGLNVRWKDRRKGASTETR